MSRAPEKCVMHGCKNNRLLRTTNIRLQMFLFPEDSNMFEFWASICQRSGMLTSAARICIDHFRDEDVETDAFSGEKRLREDAVPTRNVPNISYSILQEYWNAKQRGVKPVLKACTKKFDYVSESFSKNDNLLKALDAVQNGEATVSVAAKRFGVGYKRLRKAVDAANSKNEAFEKPPPPPPAAADSSEEDVKPPLAKLPKVEPTDEAPAAAALWPRPITSRKDVVAAAKCTAQPPPPPKMVQLPGEMFRSVVTVIEAMSRVTHNFTTYQARLQATHATLFEVNDEVKRRLLDTPGHAPGLHHLFAETHAFALTLMELMAEGGETHAIVAKIWSRAVDCLRELRRGGLLRTFITSANGCLVQVVKVIDGIIRLRATWKRVKLLLRNYSALALTDTLEPVRTKKAALARSLDDAVLLLERVDAEIHATRQKILEIKKPAIRIMEVSALDASADAIRISESGSGAAAAATVPPAATSSPPPAPQAPQMILEMATGMETPPPLKVVIKTEDEPFEVQVKTEPIECFDSDEEGGN